MVMVALFADLFLPEAQAQQGFVDGPSVFLQPSGCLTTSNFLVYSCLVPTFCDQRVIIAVVHRDFLAQSG